MTVIAMDTSGGTVPALNIGPGEVEHRNSWRKPREMLWRFRSSSFNPKPHLISYFSSASLHAPHHAMSTCLIPKPFLCNHPLSLFHLSCNVFIVCWHSLPYSAHPLLSYFTLFPSSLSFPLSFFLSLHSLSFSLSPLSVSPLSHPPG